ncbi:MAG: GNAT family N-acetyltransferase [Armatimonadetes bacterium]|nr:GNAT family N-acetyltransferase [Armatimonadota bacterium]
MPRKMEPAALFGTGPHSVAIGDIAAPEMFEAVSPAWNALVSSDPNAHLFQTYTWLSTWVRHHPGARIRVLFARRGARLTAGLGLQLHETGVWPLRTRALRFLADDASDYCDGLSDPEYPHDLGAVWSYLLAQRTWEILDLRYVPESARVAHLAAETAVRARADVRKQDEAPYLEITGDWRGRVSKNLRDNIQRRRRRLHERGRVTFEVADSEAAVNSMLSQLAPMHIARWRAMGQTSLFCLPGHRAWLSDACRRLLQARQLYLCRLALDGDPVSIGLYFLYGRRILGYTAAFSEAYANLGPTHLLEAAMLEDVQTRGLADVDDMGRGAEPYKRHWARQAQTLNRYVIASQSPLALPAFWWSSRAKPWLWQRHQIGTLARECRRRLALSRGRTWPPCPGVSETGGEDAAAGECGHPGAQR